MRKYINADAPKRYCCYCERWIVFPIHYTREHLIPRSKGGTNKRANRRDCCGSCNRDRGNRTLYDFFIYNKTKAENLIEKSPKLSEFYQRRANNTLVLIEFVEKHRHQLYRNELLKEFWFTKEPIV